MDEQLRELIALLRAKEVGSTPTAHYAHGSGGLLALPGMNRDIPSAMVLPRGLGSVLPVRRSVHAFPTRAVLTGQRASTGMDDLPTTACEPGPIPGDLKTCTRVLPFGRLMMDSPILQLDRLGELVDRGEFIDYRLINNPFQQVEDNPFGQTVSDPLNSEYQKQLFQMLVALTRDYGPLLYTGSYDNTTGSTGYIEYYGLDYQINHQYQDSWSSQLCPAVDSYVQSMAGTRLDQQPDVVIDWMHNMYRALQYRAEQVQVSLELVIVMRHQMFFMMTQYWPCVIGSLRCVAAGEDTVNNMDSQYNREMANRMYNGRYLIIDGKEVPVVIDDFIDETVPAPLGVRESDVYFVPWTVNGEPATYWEFFDMDNATLQEILDKAVPTGEFRTFGNGRYLLHKKSPNEWCLQWSILYRPRVVVEWPFLAGRLTDIRVLVPVQDRNWDPNGAYDFVNGGMYETSAYTRVWETPRNV